MPTGAELNVLTERIIGCAIRVHTEVGPGLLESAYEKCLAFELAQCGLRAATEYPVPLAYRGLQLECGYRIDFFVEDAVVVEIKSVERLAAIHTAQMLTYLRLTRCHVGLLMNFNVKLLPNGIKRVVLNFPEP